MAESLRSASIGDNSSISQAAYLAFLDRYSDADAAVADAVAERKNLRAEIKAAGIPLKALDRVRADLEKSGTVREHEETWYRRMMTWSKKPVGFQASMDLESADPTTVAFNTHELHTIDTQGLEAGKSGRRRDSNSYTPGTEAWQRWDIAWVRGQGEIAARMAPGNGAAAANGAAASTPAAAAAEGGTRRRGRPPGSRNKPKPDDATSGAATGDEPGPDAAVH